MNNSHLETDPQETTAMSERALQMLFKREKNHKLPNGKLASEYRDAVNSDPNEVRVFTTAYDWHDKPHRLVYDLLRCIDTYKRKIDRLEAPYDTQS
jgi:hypothetical protein